MTPVTVAKGPAQAPPPAQPSAPPVPSAPPAQAGPQPVVITSRAPDPRVMRFVNPVMAALLRSPLHGLLSRQVLLLTVTGRQSGRRYTVPLGYMRDGDALLVISQHADRKRWWRNLRGGASVAMHLRGRWLTGRAEVIETPMAVAAEIERLIARLGPKEASARLYMSLDITPPPTREQLARALHGVVLVRLATDGPDGAGGQGETAAAAPVKAG